MSSATLQPPGAGLPYFEKVIGKWIIFLKASRTTFDQSHQGFDEERHNILRLIQQLPVSARSQRVLIPRIRGLEDSSRHWSAYMVLEHLRIVNEGTLENILLLTQGQQPKKDVRIENVKPIEALSEEVIEAFEMGCSDYLETITTLKNQLNTTLKLRHPWFGPMDGAQWHFMMSTHMGIHRRQLEVMIQHLNQSSATL